ncbi:hypothetical protein AZI86_01205 [Bdellovibrio bacteriovorus]|uniref:Uncharacterized protein n=1 Tax=Bdellovibrio bacteriovorus TaxID=959 RepID=A0A150WMN1_BDEBC|nr:hypothetical protein [Bdellovibrio bacteriovorus]KYG65722.1 hypothetical protein AZI86_01205 [Bdellovibrio bacteriovorus]
MFDHVLNNLLWIEELLPLETESAPKHGGMAYYLDMKMIMILVEKPGTYEHKGVSYPFEIWNGCILPVEYKKQSAFFLKFSFLENHPANKDWLYIPADSENFEDEVKQFVREITKHNPLLGTPVKMAPVTKEKSEKTAKNKKMPTAVKADKKRENNFLMGILNKDKKS